MSVSCVPTRCHLLALSALTRPPCKLLAVARTPSNGHLPIVNILHGKHPVSKGNGLGNSKVNTQEEEEELEEEVEGGAGKEGSGS